MPKPSSLDDVAETVSEMVKTVEKIVKGYRRLPRLLAAALLANGHVLLEGVPGVAKTTLVKAFARLMGLTGYETVVDGVRFRGFSRIQFTPDMLPSDVTGSLVWDPSKASFRVELGPIFAYMVLADEINRASPRTQSALLEAMQERQVTIAGRTFRLEDRSRGKWFLVVATQNPVEQEGTYPLPEAQLDRFLVRLIVGYPETLEDEISVYELHAYRVAEPVEELEALVEPSWLGFAQEIVAREVRVTRDIVEAVARLVRFTRPESSPAVAEVLELGASPRAGIALIKYAKALAATRGSAEVGVEDLLEALFPILNHRLIPRIEKVVEKGGGVRARLRVVAEAVEAAAKTILGVKPSITV